MTRFVGREGGAAAVAAHLRWAKGGHAEIIRVEGDAIEVRSTTSAPPGAPLEATLVASDPQMLSVPLQEQKLTIKSYGSRKDGEAFVLKGRLISATKELRERLAHFNQRATQ